jgi:hypothetical protein
LEEFAPENIFGLETHSGRLGIVRVVDDSQSFVLYADAACTLLIS